MSGRRPDRDRDRDPDDERVKFPFGHSVEGNLEDILASDPGPVDLDSDDSDELPLGSDLRKVDGAAPETRLPAEPPRTKVEYHSDEGPVAWAPKFPGERPLRAPAPSSDGGSDLSDDDLEEDDDEGEGGDLEELSASEVGRIIDAQVEDLPKKQLFAPIPEDPARSKRLARESARNAPERDPERDPGRDPARDPSASKRAPKATSGRTSPSPPSGARRRPPADDPRSGTPTVSVDPALVPLPLPPAGSRPRAETRSGTPTVEVDPSLVPLPLPPVGSRPRAETRSGTPTVEVDPSLVPLPLPAVGTRPRSETPTETVDPRLVPPRTVRSEAPTNLLSPDDVPAAVRAVNVDAIIGEAPTRPRPLPPATPSGRQLKPVPPSELPTLHGDADDPPPRAPATPSGRQLAAKAPRPPATPSGLQPAAAATLAGETGPATIHTYVPGAPAPLPPRPRPFLDPGEEPTQAPAYGRRQEEPTRAPGYAPGSPFDSDIQQTPRLLVPLSASDEDGPQPPSEAPTIETAVPTASELAALERTHPESAGTFPSLEESGSDAAKVGSEPRGLVSTDALRLKTTSNRLILDASSSLSGLAAAHDSSHESPAFASDDSSEVTMDELGRRTAEVEVPDLGAKKRRLFQDSDITPIPDLPELFGSSEGPVSGMLESQEREALPATDSQRQLSPSLRLVQVSVERVVGLWEGDTAWVLISLGGAIVGPLLLILGWDYYSLPKSDRPGHHLDALLRPGGAMGVVFGVAGSSLFLLNLTYVARRRLGLLKKWISLRVWLNVHFICGLTGGSLILAHSALLANNDVARVSSLAIAVAIVSGVFGRYVLSHLPRRRDGEGPDLSERENVAGRLVELRRQLRQRLGKQPQIRDVALAALATDAVKDVSGTGDDGETPVHQKPRGILYLAPLVMGDLVAALKWIALSSKVRGLARRSDDPQLKKLLNETLALARVQRLEQRMAQYDAVQDLMDTWRGVHFIVALIVIATMLLHVMIVLRFSALDWLG